MPDRSLGSSIRQSTITTANYEIKTTFFQFIVYNQFVGTVMVNPNNHLDEFVNKCGTVQYKGISNESMKLIFFSYSLYGEAQDWLHLGIIQSFTYRFFHLPKRQSCIMISLQFIKKEDHYMRLGRYKGLQRKCPTMVFQI